MKFFSAHNVCCSRKPKQAHCGSHHKAWYSSWAMMSWSSFDIIYVPTWPLGISRGKWQARHSRLLFEAEMWEALSGNAVANLLAVLEKCGTSDIVLQWWTGIYKTVADGLCTAIHKFSQCLLSKLWVLLFAVVFEVTLSMVNCSILHQFTGGLKRSTPYSLVLISFLSVQT